MITPKTYTSPLLARFAPAVLAILITTALLAAMVSGCANPQAPTGGPQDETPPRVLRSVPAQDEVNVDTRSIRIEFSEYVERASLVRALSVTPAFDEQVEIDWDGRTVKLTFPEALREETTYIVTLDSELTDTRGVELNEPIQIAFSTGPRINRGRIAGTVVEPETGTPQPKVDIYAYPVPDGEPLDSLPDRPAYRTQTGEEGTFSLEYLREQPYYVIALSDANRNRQADVLEPFAAPPRPVLPGRADSEPIRIPWTIARLDTIPPTLRRIQPRSNRRVTLRFSEPVRPSLDPGDYALQDSVRGTTRPVADVFTTEWPSTEVTLRTIEPMLEGRHRLSIGDSVVVDSLGAPIADTTLGFDATTRADTSTTRFARFLPADASPDSTGAVPLLPGTAPGVAFSQPADSSEFGSTIAARDTLGAPRTLTATTRDGTSYTFSFDPSLAAGDFVEISVDASLISSTDSTQSRTFRRVTDRALGELEGQAIAVDTTELDSQPEASRSNNLQTDSVRTDSMEADSVEADSPQTDSLQKASAQVDSAVTDTAQQDSIRVDSLRETTTRRDTTQADSVAVNPTGTDAAPTLRVTFAPVDSSRLSGPVVVEMTPTSSEIYVEPRSQIVGADTTFIFKELPKGSYRFRAFLDRNENGRWDPGQIQPYEAPEPVVWSSSTTNSRPRWTTVLPASLRIPVFARPIQITVLNASVESSTESAISPDTSVTPDTSVAPDTSGTPDQ